MKKKQKGPRWDTERGLALYLEGRTDLDIADMVGASAAAVGAYRRRNHWKNLLPAAEKGETRDMEDQELRMGEPVKILYTPQDIIGGSAPCEAASTEQRPAAAREDRVEHPSHYTAGKVECIDALEAAVEGLSGFQAVCTANAIKYLWRWSRKNGKEDLKKARWYINRLLQQLGGD